MLELISDIVVDFGVSGLVSNIGATLITKSGKKWQDKLAIGLGSVIVGSMIRTAAKKHVTEKIEEAKQAITLDIKEDENGGEISE